MTALWTGPIVWIIPLAVLVVALAIGPLPITVRGYMRRHITPPALRRWYRPTTLGVAMGMIGAVISVGVIDSGLALGTALLCLLFLLASIDWQWRWLPIEWTVAVIALGFVFATQSQDPLKVLIQMAIPAGTLIVSRQLLIWTMKKETLGLGDIWLMVGLGAFLEPFQSFLVIGFAALSGLVELGFRRLNGASTAQSLGVSFGTHLCIVFVVFRNFL